jgi:AcrR family transcriptional regulator
MKKVIGASKPRGRPRSFDRDEALERAMRVFWKQGYEATSVDDLTAAMEITPPSLYGAFGDKKQLFLEAVARYEAGPGCFAEKALREEATAERAMRRLLTEAVRSFSNPDTPKGCMVVLAATNCGVESADVMNALAERRRMAERAVRARIAAGSAAGELSPDADVDALAGLVIATLYGLAICARDGASSVALHKVVAQAIAVWPHKKAKPTRGQKDLRSS